MSGCRLARSLLFPLSPQTSPRHCEPTQPARSSIRLRLIEVSRVEPATGRSWRRAGVAISASSLMQSKSIPTEPRALLFPLSPLWGEGWGEGHKHFLTYTSRGRREIHLNHVPCTRLWESSPEGARHTSPGQRPGYEMKQE
jgi:hypothetical protein